MARFEIKITRDRSEIREAQRLRFEVFNLEMQKGLQASYRQGLDVDDYDPLCDHLIVRDPNNKKVVGTYRLLRSSQALSHLGFYSEREFALDNIKRLSGESLELGRSCAHKDYRDKALISFMWDAIADYVKRHNVRYIFGCASLLTTEAWDVSRFYSYLKENFYAAEYLRVYPVPDKIFPGLDENVIIANGESIFMRLPSLIKGYLRIGARLCGPPALDAEFGTTDLFLFLDVGEMSAEYKQRFGLTGPGRRHAAG